MSRLPFGWYPSVILGIRVCSVFSHGAINSFGSSEFHLLRVLLTVLLELFCSFGGVTSSVLVFPIVDIIF
jgi:hypothetical protein